MSKYRIVCMFTDAGANDLYSETGLVDIKHRVCGSKCSMSWQR